MGNEFDDEISDESDEYEDYYEDGEGDDSYDPYNYNEDEYIDPDSDY